MNSSDELSKDKKELNKKKLKNIFTDLKSDYFLQKLFNNLSKKKSLDIIKYNKYLKDKMNISIKDYKEYLEIYSSIEIKIKLIDEKYFGFIKDKCLKFINIDKENENYYHIYLNNNNKEEIKRNYLNENEKNENLEIILDYQIKSFRGLFEDCKCIKYIFFKKFYRNNIDNMERMFCGCNNLNELNLSNFNTANVTNMDRMFCNCLGLKELNLSKFNTVNVTNMSCMFYECSD